MLCITQLIHRTGDIAAGSVLYNSNGFDHRQRLYLDLGCTDATQAGKHEREAADSEQADVIAVAAEMECPGATKP